MILIRFFFFFKSSFVFAHTPDDRKTLYGIMLWRMSDSEDLRRASNLQTQYPHFHKCLIPTARGEFCVFFYINKYMNCSWTIEHDSNWGCGGGVWQQNSELSFTRSKIYKLATNLIKPLQKQSLVEAGHLFFGNPAKGRGPCETLTYTFEEIATRTYM